MFSVKVALLNNKNINYLKNNSYENVDTYFLYFNCFYKIIKILKRDLFKIHHNLLKNIFLIFVKTD